MAAICPRCRRFTITRNAIRIIHERFEDRRESIAAFVIPRAHEGMVIDSEMLGESMSETTKDPTTEKPINFKAVNPRYPSAMVGDVEGILRQMNRNDRYKP